jgi:hypothetical protein
MRPRPSDANQNARICDMAYTPTSSRYDKKWDDFDKRNDGDHDYGDKYGKRDGDHDHGDKYGKRDGDHDHGNKYGKKDGDHDHGDKYGKKDGDHDHGDKYGKKDGDHDHGDKYGKKDGDHDHGDKYGKKDGDHDYGDKHAEHDCKPEKCEPIKCEPVKPPCDSNPSHPTDGVAWNHDGGYDPSDLHGALASMPATAAVDFAIDHLGGTHAPLDMAHFDGADTVHHDALA